MEWNYEDAAAYLLKIPRFSQAEDEDLKRKTKKKRMTWLLHRLGDPQDHMRILHVAGTNGKGSVCAFADAILRDAGHRVGLFTSPHLERMNERMRINGEWIADEDFAAAFNTILGLTEEMEKEGMDKLTFFEFLFAMAMWWFARERIDTLVMETGLGGRLDVTTVVKRVSVCVITSISRDHMYYLGDTITAIAAEKAGILRESTPVVFDASDPEAAQVIRRAAMEKHAPFYECTPEMITLLGADDRSRICRYAHSLLPSQEVYIPFPADYQMMNCALAMMAVRLMDPEGLITPECMLRSVRSVSWPGRMEEILPGVILEGAHNMGGIRQLVKSVKERAAGKERAGGQEASLLFAVAADKEYEAMIRELARAGFSHITATTFEGGRALDPELIRTEFEKYTQVEAECAPKARDAFSLALKKKGKHGVLYCAGSLYMIGELRALIGSGADGSDLHGGEPRDILKQRER